MTLRRLGVSAALAFLAVSAIPACSATANISDVWMSIDEDGARRRNVFFTDSAAITCIAEVGVGRKDVTVEILIRQIRVANPGTEDFVAIDAVVSAGDYHPDVTKDKPALIGLTLKPTTVDENGQLKEDQAAPFRAGSYICEAYLDGAKQKQAAFNIDYAPCPTVIIQAGTPCVGFYPLGKQCPQSGASGDPQPTCACEEKGWNCP